MESIKRNGYPLVKVLGEPQLGKRGLYPLVNAKQSEVQLIVDIITWSDGTNSLIDIAEKCGIPVWETYPIIEELVGHNLLEVLDASIGSPSD